MHNMNIVFLTCTHCKNEYPKTDEYFYTQITKQKNKKSIGIYYSFRNPCKICWNKKQSKNKNETDISKIDYKQYCKINRSKANRKYIYNNSKNRTLTKKEQQECKKEIHTVNLSDSYITNKLRLKVGECPKELIETKRLIIQIKRTLKNQ